MIEFDEAYWVRHPPIDRLTHIGQEVARTIINGKPARIVTTAIDANSIAEQLIAGVTLLAIGAAGAHFYETYKRDQRG